MEAGIFKPTVQAKARVKFIEEIWKGIFDEDIVLTKLSYYKGCVRFDELLYLAAIVKHVKPRTIFEFGTCRGRTTVNMAANADNVETIYTINMAQDARIDHAEWHEQDYLLYHDSKNEIGAYYRSSPYKSKIVQILGDTLCTDLSCYNDIDIIFVDANKSYKYVLSDSEKAYSMLSEKGMIIWHDYNYADEVTEAVDDFAKAKGIAIVNIYKTTLGVYIK
jgi:predicted O-methyltransferase YrrM